MKSQQQIQARSNMLKTSRKNGVKDLDEMIDFLDLVAISNFDSEYMSLKIIDAAEKGRYKMLSLYVWILE